jgi:hypothetical protein
MRATRMRRLLPLVTALAGLACAGCDGALEKGAAASAAVPPHGLAVDSIFPMPEMIARFQASVPRRTSAFDESAARSRDELVERFAAAVADNDAEALAALRLDVSEFAFLYFPSSRFAQPPLAQPPHTAWLMVEQNGLKGETRLLRSFGGRRLEIESTTCEEDPVVEGENRLFEHCRVHLRDGSSLRLFGSVMQRDGRYRFVSMANEL